MVQDSGGRPTDHSEDWTVRGSALRYRTKQEQFEALCRTFPIEAIKEREQGGSILYYYPVEVVRHRLNEVFAGDYEFHVKQVFISEKTMDVTCELVLRWVDGTNTVVEECGSSDILFSAKGTRTNDPLKSALSDGLKRCLAFVGCGSELWSESYREGIAARIQQQKEAEQERAKFTCQECEGEIVGGNIGSLPATRDEVVLRTRKAFKKRLCLGCATSAAAARKSAA